MFSMYYVDIHPTTISVNLLESTSTLNAIADSKRITISMRIGYLLCFLNYFMLFCGIHMLANVTFAFCLDTSTYFCKIP